MEVNKPIAIVLGGSIPHVPLIVNLKKRGYYVVLLDYLTAPLAKKYADKHDVISITDKESILQKAIEYKAELVINLCLDKAIASACYVSERLNLKTLYDYKTSKLVTDKSLMKRIMKSKNIPTSNFIVLKEEDRNDVLEKTRELSYPLIVKPIDGTGSLGVFKINKEQELQPFIERSLEQSTSKELIVEEFVEGKEWNLYFIFRDEEPELIMTLEKVKNRERNGGMQQIGSVVVPEHENDYLKEINILAKDIAKAFGLNKGPLLIQVKVDNRNLYVIEFAARLGGTALSNSMLQSLKEIDIIDFSVNAYLGIKNKFNTKDTSAVIISNFLYAKPGVFQEVQGLDKIKERGLIEEYFIFKKEGDIIDPGLTSKNRVGAFFVKANTKAEAINKINFISSKIDVVSKNGESLLLKKCFIC